MGHKPANISEKNMNYTKDIIAILVVIAAGLSLFFNVDQTAAEFVRVAGGMVIGFYFGAKQIPIISAFKKNK
jgi:hypothetical protein